MRSTPPSKNHQDRPDVDLAPQAMRPALKQKLVHTLGSNSCAMAVTWCSSMRQRYSKPVRTLWPMMRGTGSFALPAVDFCSPPLGAFPIVRIAFHLVQQAEWLTTS